MLPVRNRLGMCRIAFLKRAGMPLSMITAEAT
jgi:hypothetical protein